MRVIRTIDVGGNGARRADFGSDDPLKFFNYVCVGKDLLSSPGALLDFVSSNLHPGTTGIVYAMAGEIEDGTIVKSPQIPILNGFNLKEATARQTRMTILVVNDMDGATMGMKAFLPDVNYFMAITWSSGIGVRIFRNGEILARGEGGHIPLDISPFASLCGCGLRGCAESIIGGEAIKRRIIAEMGAMGRSIPVGVHPCAFLDRQFKQGERWAMNIRDLIAKGMGTFLTYYQSIFKIPWIVWKGTFALKVLKEMEGSIRTHMEDTIINRDWVTKLGFQFSGSPEYDSLIGAAALYKQAFP